MKTLLVITLLGIAACTKAPTAPRPNGERSMVPCRTNGSCR